MLGLVVAIIGTTKMLIAITLLKSLFFFFYFFFVFILVQGCKVFCFVVNKHEVYNIMITNLIITWKSPP